jgi:prolyl-tRNA synthetase
MRQSKLFLKTYKEFPSDETSKNARFLIRAGFIDKLSAGVYNLLPLGFLVIEKIKKIIREELNLLGCQELLLANLHLKKYWQKTKRWDEFDVLFKIKGNLEEYALAPTHEEVIFPLIKKTVFSYKQLPLALYQINTKYRDELRAKSGLLRNREFIMKDLYSFHLNNEDLERFKKRVDEVYTKIFNRLGLKTIKTLASGGTFSKFSTEFQVPTESGEDSVYLCSNCNLAWNKEIIKKEKCENCNKDLEVYKTIEVGNTFNLGTKFSEIFEVFYLDNKNQKNLVWAGCYGIGITRVLGAIAEIYNDKNGLIWPESVSPFKVHLILLFSPNSQKNNYLFKIAENLYQKLCLYNIDTLFDDRTNVSNGEKLFESDLIGITYKIIIGERFLKSKKLELVSRKNGKIKELKINEIINFFKSKK